MLIEEILNFETEEITSEILSIAILDTEKFSTFNDFSILRKFSTLKILDFGLGTNLKKFCVSNY